MVPEQVIYYVYEDAKRLGVCKPLEGSPTVNFVLSPASLTNPKAVIRLIAKDGSQSQDEDQQTQVGCISFNMEYFRGIYPNQYGQNFLQWITLFDDAEDDDFDGDLGEDDEELPMIRVNFVANEVVEKPPPVKEQPKPAERSYTTLEKQESNSKPKAPSTRPSTSH